METRRICCLCETWESGGIEAFLTNTLLHMDRTGLEIDVVAEAVRDSVFTDKLKAAGVGLLELSGSTRDMGRNLRLFRKLLREKRYDVIHLNCYQALSLEYLTVAGKEGVPVRMAHSHNAGLRKSPLRPVKMLLHRSFRRLLSGSATDRLACSGPAAEFMFPGGQPWEFMPNGIELERFAFKAEARESVRRALGLENSFVVGNVGRLCRQKNQMFLLDVLAALRKERPEAALLLVGDGEQRPALEARASELGIAGDVIFYGVSDDVPRLLWAMDVFVLPSLFEGLGIVVIEAQAAGLPVICSEAVPPEAAVTELAERLPLGAGPKIWASRISAIRSDARPDVAEALRGAGFDVSEAAARLEAIYRR